MTQESENKSFATRLWELPVAMAAVEQLSQTYSLMKEWNSVTKMACNAGERMIQMTSAATKPIIGATNSFSLSKLIVGKVECAAATIDRVASATLAKVEEKCPIITKTPTEIKTTVTDAVSQYYNIVQNHTTVKMMIARTDDMLSFTESIAETALPTDSTCEEDMEELKAARDDHAKGALVRTQNLRKIVTRRGKRKLMSYRPITFSVNTMSIVQEKVTYLAVKSSDAGKTVYSATMYAPNMALQLSGEVIVSAKQLVFDVHKVMTEYLLFSRPIQWMIPRIVALEDINKPEITIEEIEDINKQEITIEEIEETTTESDENEIEKES